jgi:hypothetical protein
MGTYKFNLQRSMFNVGRLSNVQRPTSNAEKSRMSEGTHGRMGEKASSFRKSHEVWRDYPESIEI